MFFNVDVRIAAAVYLALEPTLNQIKENFTAVKADIANLNERVNSLAGQIELQNEESASQLAAMQYLWNVSLEFKLAYFSDNVMSQIISLLTIMNDSIRDNLNTELNRINETASAKMDKLQVKLDLVDGKMNETLTSIEIDAEMRAFHTKLNMLSESMQEDFTDVKTKLDGITHGTTPYNVDGNLVSELKEMKENLTRQISGYTCGGTGGWRRAVYLDMTDPNTNCPTGWNMTTYNTTKRMCGRASSRYMSCDSVFFPVSGGPYSKVCGRITGYQWGIPEAFYDYYDEFNQPLMSEAYFSGVTIMHGRSRQHIWTFAAGGRENYSSSSGCPCDSRYPDYIFIPSFVGEDYFCESGYVYPGYWSRESYNTFYFNDTLWDGRDCHNSSRCCSFQNPPYFTKTLDETTTDDLELRMCLVGSVRHSNITVELVELYVKEDYVHNTLYQMQQHLEKSFSLQTNNINQLQVHTCGGTGGWRRAVYLDMTDPNTNCPTGWNMTNYDKRTCGRASRYGWRCDSAFFPVSGGQYSQVCGRIRAYQFGVPGFFPNWRDPIDGPYFDGVAVMHGSPRQHIWTFAMGHFENYSTSSNCPCDLNYNSHPIPSYVGNDYFCESGIVHGPNVEWYTLHSNDTLWNGKDCHSTSSCCSFHNPPYFTKTLNETTNDDLELRICFNNGADVNVAVELVDLYVK